MRVNLFELAVLCLAMATPQQQPDFSGEWSRVVEGAANRPSVAATGDASFARGDMGSGWGSTVTIRQSADSLIVEYVFFSTYDLKPPLRLAYALDGSETRHSVMIGHAATTQRSRATWQGDTLVITTLHPVPSAAGAVVEVRQALTLESPTLLVVETTRGAVFGGSVNATRVVYTKR